MFLSLSIGRAFEFLLKRKLYARCGMAGSMLCDQAAFILERQGRGAEVTGLAEFLFVWVERSLVRRPAHAEKVHSLLAFQEGYLGQM